MPDVTERTIEEPRHSQSWLAALLAVALVLRLVLVSCGGQYFFGDEGRHGRGIALYEAVRAGDVAGIELALARPEHIGFTVLGAGITGLQHLGSKFTRWGDWSHPENVTFTLQIGAAWLALFSVLNIWLVHCIARRAGAGKAEAGWAALLMACSNTGFYYSRHFLPYDAALSCALFAILAGLNGQRSFLCGLLAGATYHFYNGYWYLVPVALALHLGWSGAGAHPRVRRFVLAGTGAAIAFLAPIAVGFAIAGRSYGEAMLAFSRTVYLGVYREGWSLPWEYFWHSEGILELVVCLTIGGGIIAALQTRSSIGERMWFWLAAATMSYGCLVLLSVGLEKFVVYARSVKPLVPFFCLAGGWAAAHLLDRRRSATRVAITACCIAAGVNFLPLFGLIFPGEVQQRVLREIGNPKHSLSISGSLYQPLALPVTRPDLLLVNARLLYPIRSYIGFPEGKVIFSLPHPLTYLPFQYECHTPRERALLRTLDINIRLIRLAYPAQVPNDLAREECFIESDRPDGRH